MKIDIEQITLGMNKYVLDILIVIPHNKILVKGITYVRDIIDTV